MAGLVLDIYLVLLFRWIVTGVGVFRSRNWTIVPGKVDGAWADVGSYPVVRIPYLYTVAGVEYPGRYAKGFSSRDSARVFVKRFPKGMLLAIRYNPADPAKSFLREGDQRPALLHRLEAELQGVSSD